jgi:PPM family protein phosphatase
MVSAPSDLPHVEMHVFALTDVGRARDTNEDAFAVMDLASGRQIEAQAADSAIDVQDRGVLLALSDGMGGHEAGEVASALVLESLQASLRDATAGPIHEQLEQGVHLANRNVKSAAQDRSRHRMGATLTAVLVHGGEAYIAEVGDSRAYLLRNGRLRQITRDQSLVQMLIDQGVLSAEQARRSNGRNVILQAVGLLDDVRVAIARLELRREDRFLLCSDGVTNAVTDDELRQILMNSEPRAACETMIALANDRGGDDNETAIVADVTGAGLELPDEFETVTSTYEVLKAYEATMFGRPVSPFEAQVMAAAISPRAAPAPRLAPDDDVFDQLPDLPEAPALPAPPPLPDRPAPPAATIRTGMSRRAVIAVVVALLAAVAVMLALAWF